MDIRPPRAQARLFIALELPVDWRETLARLQRAQERAAPGYFRWVQPPQLHLTLLFLGAQPLERLPELISALERASATVPPFAWSLGRLGTFGPPSSPRVLWIEVRQPDNQLVALRAALEDELRALNIAFDAKPFVPHITLGRGRNDARGRPRILAPALRTRFHVVEQLVLMESVLSPQGPQYTVRAVAKLRKNGPGRGE